MAFALKKMSRPRAIPLKAEQPLPVQRAPREPRDDSAIGKNKIPVYVAEFWTSKQRQASSLHEISYRACFKAQLPQFFIDEHTDLGDLVYDPFMGRGTTIIEAALLGRRVIGNDVNPLCKILTEPRLIVPTIEEVEERLSRIEFSVSAKAEIDLSMFFHAKTLAEIVSLKRYLVHRKATGKEDRIDKWIRMVATNRLTGHSGGFFSVYTLPTEPSNDAGKSEKNQSTSTSETGVSRCQSTHSEKNPFVAEKCKQ